MIHNLTTTALACLAPLLMSAEGVNPLIGSPSANLVVTGFSFTEGPVWDEASGGLLFSDLDKPFRSCAGEIHLLTGTSVTTLYSPSCNSNGLAFDEQGRLLVAEHGSRKVRRLIAGGSFETVAESYLGTPLNAPNDIAVRSDGTIYFTDPDFVNPDPPLLGFNGLFRVDPLTGSLVLEAQMSGPNGLALSPDELTLYVANQDQDQVVSYDVQPDGTLLNEHVFLNGTPGVDGMTVDGCGNLYLALTVNSTGIIAVYAPNGTPWGSVTIPEPARNCAIGGADKHTLFVTANTSIYSIDLTLPALTQPTGTTGPLRAGRSNGSVRQR